MSLGNYACSYEGRRVKTVGANEGGATKTADQGNPETKSAALDSIFVFESGKNAADKTRHTASTMRPRRLAESFTTLTVRFDHAYASELANSSAQKLGLLVCFMVKGLLVLRQASKTNHLECATASLPRSDTHQ